MPTPPLASGYSRTMIFEDAVGIVLALCALAYLGYAMLRPEKF